MAQGLEAKEPLADKQIAGIIELDPYLVDANPFWKGAQQLTIVEVRALSHMPIRHAFPFAGKLEKKNKKADNLRVGTTWGIDPTTDHPGRVRASSSKAHPGD